MVPEATVRNVDVLQLTNAPFRRLYGKFYLDLVNKAPHVLGYFYDLLDKPSRSGKNRTDRLRLAIEKLNLRKFIRFLKDEPWDLVINTHFLPAEIIASLRRSGELTLPQVTATTDFETHRLWVNQPCEHYYTATEEGARYLQHWGVPAERRPRPASPFTPSSPNPRIGRSAWLATDWRVIAQSFFSFPAASASGRLPSFTAPCWRLRSPSNWSPSPDAMRRCARNWKRSRRRRAIG